MNKFDIKDGEYTSTISGLIKVKSFMVNIERYEESDAGAEIS